MNNQGRAQISKIIRSLENLSKNVLAENLKETVAFIEDVAAEVEDLASEEREINLKI